MLPGLDHLGRNKQQGLPPPALEHPGTSGGQTPRTGASGTEQAAGASAPVTGSSGDKRQPDTTDCIIRGGSSSRSRRTPDWIIRAQMAARRPGLGHPGWKKQHEPPPPGSKHLGTSGGLTPRAASSGVDQGAGATAPRTGLPRYTWWADALDWIIRGRTRRSSHNPQGWIHKGKVACRSGRIARGGSTRRGPHLPGWSVQGKVAATGERDKRARPRLCNEQVMSGSNAKDNAAELQ